MNKWLERAVGILFPRRCPICGEIVCVRGRMICEKCKKEVVPIREPLCKKCGKPLGDAEKEYCYDCADRQHLFIRGAALLSYEGKVKESIYQIKFHNKREYLDYYSMRMGTELLKQVTLWQADMLIPVPLHRWKERQRGFNQAEVLAKHLGRAFGLPVVTRAVVRRRRTKPQKELLLKERQDNLRGAFVVKDQALIGGKTIIIIDDIYTTGTTVDEVAAVLLAAGARKIYFLALCIGREDC